jgi:hypothetical protein
MIVMKLSSKIKKDVDNGRYLYIIPFCLLREKGGRRRPW